jgi:hypothetical protein
MTQRRYAEYMPARRWRRLTSWLRRGRTEGLDTWRGDPDTIRLVRERGRWVLRWAEPAHDRSRHYGHAALDGLLDWARADKGERIEAVRVSMDADLAPRSASIGSRHHTTPRTWVEVSCTDPGPLRAAAHEFFGPGEWVQQPGQDPTYITR